MLRKIKSSLLNQTSVPTEPKIDIATGLSLIAQYVNGSTVIEVAHHHKLTVKEVGVFLRSVNILNNRPKPKPILSDRDFDIINLNGIGIPTSEIAKEFGISVAEVKMILSKNNKKGVSFKANPLQPTN
jgi:DNA-binding CsgD family transcriptional regulator